MSEFIPARVKSLQAKIAAREGQPGYAKNVEALKAELAHITAPVPEISTASIHGAE